MTQTASARLQRRQGYPQTNARGINLFEIEINSFRTTATACVTYKNAKTLFHSLPFEKRRQRRRRRPTNGEKTSHRLNRNALFALFFAFVLCA